jgi:hypothetical protein
LTRVSTGVGSPVRIVSASAGEGAVKEEASLGDRGSKGSGFAEENCDSAEGVLARRRR